MLVLVLLLTLSAQEGPPLPALALDAFPPAARDSVARAQRDVTARPSDAAAVGAFGRALQAWEQWESAHQAYSRAQALAPRTFDWQYLDAVVLQRLMRPTDAAARLKTAVSLNSAYLPARVRLAEALLDAGDLTASRPMFEALSKEAVAEPAAQVGLGKIAALQGDHERAIVHFKRAIELFPELGAAYYSLARSYRATGRRADAEQALAQHARFGATWPRLDDPVLSAVTELRDDGRALLARGLASAKTGEIEAAIALHEQALVRDPSLTQVHANLLSLYGQLKNSPKAEEHYHAAVQKGVNSADLHYDYGVVLASQEKWDAAAEAYRRAIAVNPLHVRARNNLGQLLERQGQIENAAAEYRKAADAQPSFKLAGFNLGRMLLVLKRPDEAAAEFEKLLEPRDADTPRYLFALSTAYVHAGRIAEGIKRATEARQLAVDLGQTELAAAIDRELARLK